MLRGSSIHSRRALMHKDIAGTVAVRKNPRRGRGAEAGATKVAQPSKQAKITAKAPATPRKQAVKKKQKAPKKKVKRK